MTAPCAATDTPATDTLPAATAAAAAPGTPPASAVLVTGATTPIGIALVRALAGDPRFLRVLAVGIEPGCGPLAALDPKVVYRQVDLTHARNVRRLLFGEARALGVDAVVHTALHRSALDLGPRIHRLNVETTRELLAAAETHPTIRRFVYRSFADIYRLEPERPCLVAEDHPLELAPEAAQRVRDRVEADVIVCARIGDSPLHVTVLRCAEVLAPGCGSQLHDYLESAVCLRPLGFDPMVNVLTVEDAVRAAILALRARARGVFNIPGKDTLPLSEAIALSGRRGIALPGPLIAPLYRLRTRVVGLEFDYGLNHRRFHFTGVLDGARAREALGYVPGTPVAWPARRREG